MELGRSNSLPPLPRNRDRTDPGIRKSLRYSARFALRGELDYKYFDRTMFGE